jgi:type II secretory pathway pseudopilin PulG
MRTPKSAFTLIELVTTFALLGVFTLVAVQQFGDQRETGTEAAATQVLEQLSARQDLELSGRGVYTDSTERLGEGVQGTTVVNGAAEEGQVSVALGSQSGYSQFGLAYHLGERCYTIRVSEPGGPSQLSGTYETTNTPCSGQLALEGNPS